MSEDYKVQVSLKFGPGMLGLLNLRANTPQELDTLIRDTTELLVVPIGGLTEEIAPLANIQQAFPQTQVINQGQPQQSAQPAVTGRSCQHGQMTYRTGNQNTPDAWAGYFCPLGKGDPAKCRPQYVGK